MIYVMGSPQTIQYSRTFTEDEYQRLSTALPEGKHPGWYAVLRDHSLCIYRASGWCAFQLELTEDELRWAVKEAWVDFRGRYSNEDYVNKLIDYILDGLMFGRSVEFPTSNTSTMT